MSTAEIRSAGDSEDMFVDIVRALDARLAASIERDQSIRADLAELLAHRTGPDVPVGFESIADGLTGADRAVISISTLLYDEQGMQDLHEIAEHHQDTDIAFNELPADAGAEAIHAVALRLAPVLRRIHDDYPDTRIPPQPTTARRREAIHALYQSLPDLYNPAQISVLAQAYHLAQEHGPADEADA
jgi:hypothetical protein